MSAVTEILAMRSEIEGRFEMLDLAIERIEAERREYRIRLETLNTCLDLVSREVAGSEAEEKAEGENVTRVTGAAADLGPLADKSWGEFVERKSVARPAPRASKRAPRRNPRQVVLELIRKAKGEGTTVEALDAAMPTYRKRLIENAVAHWISKGNVIETAGGLYCHGFEPEAVKSLAAQIYEATLVPGTPSSAPVSGPPQQLGLESLPNNPPLSLDTAPASPAGSTMRQRLIEFMAARGGAAIMQEIMASGIDQAEVYRAERAGKIEAVDARGTYALVLDEAEEAQAAAE